jgi:hypothetical protein
MADPNHRCLPSTWSFTVPLAPRAAQLSFTLTCEPVSYAARA